MPWVVCACDLSLEDCHIFASDKEIRRAGLQNNNRKVTRQYTYFTKPLPHSIHQQLQSQTSKVQECP